MVTIRDTVVFCTFYDNERFKNNLEKFISELCCKKEGDGVIYCGVECLFDIDGDNFPEVVVDFRREKGEQESHTPEIKKELGLSDITPVCFKEEKRKKIFYREDIDDKWNRLKQNIVAAANTGECGDQAATDNIFDALENTGIYEDIEPFYGKVHKAVEKQKNKKASRTEEIPSELIKNRGGNYIKELTDLILVI
ncbi:hypothetical protein CWI37_1329p0020 [Hamiltosporidium tvaerminnensis]|uniref:Uncharacterized protein n=1 Tax=Hamiltosporidium tvaerminnensis TaxID=1176355 RepID=A0A4Q9KYI4_9MICR|nr:hypothetical protein CWI37_1329p0020 [Hamiltosporidium tvaerminnensis]